MERTVEKNVYRIQGLSCANCAKKFETNVRNLDGVDNAIVNFAASKITVYGKTTIEALEKAGAFENLKIIKENEAIGDKKEPFYKKYGSVFFSSLFLLSGLILHVSIGENHLLTIGAYALSIVIGGYKLFFTGLKNFLRLDFDMKTLMTIAIIGAAIIGEWEEGAIVVILFAISQQLEVFSMEKARQSIRKLMDATSKEAIIRRNNKEIPIHVDDIQVDDVMIVRPGEKIALDGIVLKGSSTVNQAPITGEAIPVWKEKGDEVYGGTLNQEGLLEVRVTKKASDTIIAKIIQLVEDAQEEKASSQSFVDRFAKVYTPIIMLISAFVAIIPPLLFQGDWTRWIYEGLAVLVVGCPCALVISTPVAIVTAIGNAARNGVLIKGGIHLEELGQIEAIAFDKTGTLTKGIPAVTNFIPLEDGRENEIFAYMAALEKNSNHPLGAAILKKAEEMNVSFQSIEVSHFSSLTGLGIKGEINGETYMIGRRRMFPFELSQAVVDMANKLEKDGKTVVFFGTNEKILAIVAIFDGLRESSKHVIETLYHLGMKEIAMLTGDNKGAADAIGQKAGLTKIYSQLLPEDKLHILKNLKNQYQKVAMVGDGVNDAPALAASSVGIAMGGAGSDTVLETADVALMSDDLRKIPYVVQLSRKTLTIIKENIIFSLGIKLFALLLVIPGWLTLWIAIFADMGATLIVTLNALRLLKIKTPNS